MADVDVSVVIPVYRSESSLRPLVARLLLVLEATGRSHEIIFVEDGGDDGSWRILRELQARHPDRITAIQLMRNYGQHNALMCGFHNARGELIVTLDDDLQNPPEEVPRLLDRLRSGDFDLVYGRYVSKKHSLWRNAGSLLVNAFYRTVFGSPIQVSSFRAIRRPLLNTILTYDLNFTFVDGLLAWNTQRIGQVEVEHLPRTRRAIGVRSEKARTPGPEPVYQFLPAALADCVRLRTRGVGCRFPAGVLLPHPGTAFQYRRAGLCLDHHRRADHRRNPTLGAWHHRRIPRSSPFERESKASVSSANVARPDIPRL